MSDNILIVTHNSPLDGPINYYENFLLRNDKKVFLLNHPLDNYNNRRTIFFENKKEVSSIKRFDFGLFNLFIDYLISFSYIFRCKFAIFIGANNFDAFAGIIARKFGKKIDKIIYFASDFSEDRFKNKMLNKIYYFIEKKVLNGADIVVSNTRRSESKRLELGLDADKSIVVPNGVYLKDAKFMKKDILKDNFIFVGSVTREHGLYDLLREISPLIKKLVLIGAGDDWDNVLRLCKEKDINLEYHHEKDHDFTVEYLQKFAGIGLAPYNLESKWTYYCSPLKISEYIACGLPVLMSSLPEIAKYVEENKLGIIYDNLDGGEISSKLNSFDAADFYLKAGEFYHTYNQDSLYSKIKL